MKYPYCVDPRGPHTNIIVPSKTLDPNLSIEGSNIFLSLVQMGFLAAQTRAFFDKLHVLNF